MSPERLHQIEELYHSARECESGRRRAFLMEACSGDEDLRREVESLLAQDSAGNLMGRPAIEVAASLLADETTTQLTPGVLLGPYKIEALLGSGGMGQVFRARDTRLGRAVAIKISNARFSDRFEREARAISALNHPNICQLYDVGPNFLVMELVYGSPVAPTDSIRKLLDIAVQLADGMAAAHAAGFVHRDLKPSNVLVTREGRVKILDFGIVKVVAKPDDVNSTQFTLTESGMVAGTAAYMSPEQASGSANLDARSDQFSCGLMLYEMASGKRAFKRSSAAETLTAIIREDPEPLPATIPAPLRWIIHRCLAKEPRDRYESSRDLYLELRGLRENLSDASSSTAIPALTAQPKRGKSWGALLVFAAGVALTAGIALLLRPAPAPRVSPLRYTPFSFEQGGQNSPVWSPDGKAVAFAARQKETDPYQVYVRYLDLPVPTQVTHIAENAFPLEWTSTGRIIFLRQRQRVGLWWVSPVGGEPELLLEPAGITASVARDGSAAVIFRGEKGGLDSLWISAPPGAPLTPYQPAPFATPIVAAGSKVKFSPDGKQILLIFNARGSQEVWLMPYPANAAKPPHRILEGLPVLIGGPTFSWMPDNRRVVISTAPGLGATIQLYMADTVSGKFDVLSSGTTAQMWPAVSPDGTKLIFEEPTQNLDIVSVDLATLSVTSLIATQRSEEMPAWAARDQALVYVTNRAGGYEIWLHKPDQLDRPLVTERDFPPDTTQGFMAPSLSADAGRVIYSRIERNGPTRLWISAVAGGAPVRLTRADAGTEFPGSWSPDGNWYAFLNVQNRKASLMKVKTTGQAQPEVLKADTVPGFRIVPAWSPADNWILYPDKGLKSISPDGKTVRDLKFMGEAICTFSSTGAMLYCGRLETGAGGRVQFFSASLEGKVERMIGSLGPEFTPDNSLIPSLRLSLTPDGKSVTYSTLKASSNLWLVDGLSLVK